MRRVILALAVCAVSVPAGAQILINGVPPTTPQVDAVKAQLDTLALTQAVAYTRTLDANGSDAIDFSPAFTAPPRIAYFPQNPDTAGKPIVCNYQTLTATRLTYHCDKSPGTIATLLNPLFNPLGAAGATVQVIVRGTMVTMP